MVEHVVVMAAGEGRRMGDLTRTRPKAMLPILGKPMIARVMDGFYQVGVRRFTVVVGQHEGSVAGWLSRKWHPDAALHFVPQGYRRGTAAALLAARDTIDGCFILTSCDNLIPERHAARLVGHFEARPGDVAVLSLIYAPDQVATSAGVLLAPDGHVASIAEKPTDAHPNFLTSFSVYGFAPHILDYLDRVPMSASGERVLTDAIQAMIDDGLAVGHTEAEWRQHLTHPEDLLQVNMRYLSELNETSLLSELPPSVQVISPVRVDSGVTVGQGVRLGPNVYLEAGSVVGQAAELSYCVVLGCTVGARQRVTDQIVGQDQR
jgi:NDP-sugar pyrophosphorylase family protein